MRRALALSCLGSLASASAAPRLQPGLWTITSAPTGATLDGRVLGDLPYATPPETAPVCVTLSDVADPAHWLARAEKSCTFGAPTFEGDRIAITGTCEPQAPGLARGTIRIAGRWTPTAYDLTFATTNPSENGVMGFTGTLTGRRTGACAGEPVRPAPRP